MYEPNDPPCGDCIVELDEGNHKAWQLWNLCSSQVLRAGMDGTVVALDLRAAISIVEFYGEGQEMFNKMLLIWGIEQEMRDK